VRCVSKAWTPVSEGFHQRNALHYLIITRSEHRMF
jgi:hypothetical protein